MKPPTLAEESTDPKAAESNHGACWRAECRHANHPYRTVLYQRGNVVVARCHRREYTTMFDLVSELWAHAG
jgi:hypothetical protein